MTLGLGAISSDGKCAAGSPRVDTLQSNSRRQQNRRAELRWPREREPLSTLVSRLSSLSWGGFQVLVFLASLGPQKADHREPWKGILFAGEGPALQWRRAWAATSRQLPVWVMPGSAGTRGPCPAARPGVGGVRVLGFVERQPH